MSQRQWASLSCIGGFEFVFGDLKEREEGEFWVGVKMEGEGRSLAETPTYLVATVVSVLVALGFFFHGSLKRVGKGHESFASYESLEQLHRFLFVLAIVHVSYSFAAIVLAMIKIYSWKTWENQAKTMAIQGLRGEASKDIRLMRLSTFIVHHTSHPWSQHKLLVWLLCFSRQFWSSINRPDYMALRLGFITTHELPLSYDFHNYMLRSMEDEFRDVVGISVPLWIYAIFCIFLDFHGSNIYFWLSFLPSILILLIGTKLHHVVVKLAVEIMDSRPQLEDHQFKLRDELFWFGKPQLLLWLIQFISFQNAFEMTTFIWSLWEIRDTTCFMNNRSLLVIRLTFGVVSQFWCSFITFPLYVIVTQMGSKFKKSVMSESVRTSLHGWQRRAKAKHTPLLSATSVTSLDSLVDDMDRFDGLGHHQTGIEGSSLDAEDSSFSHHDELEEQSFPLRNDGAPGRLRSGPIFDIYSSDEDCDLDVHNEAKDGSCINFHHADDLMVIDNNEPPEEQRLA
ncbi:MLO-like protein 4 isoform X2 [Rhodamnia argentea]|uniref:MLO-like protein n=1 Tax=Rhodamnia argentea TaxID=178133 RepID=A0A8B8PMN8_9MYRT|nr:MLO-like protein 4 isoform X2 [Rhodamnia argentea]